MPQNKCFAAYLVRINIQDCRMNGKWMPEAAAAGQRLWL